MTIIEPWDELGARPKSNSWPICSTWSTSKLRRPRTRSRAAPAAPAAPANGQLVVRPGHFDTAGCFAWRRHDDPRAWARQLQPESIESNLASALRTKLPYGRRPKNDSVRLGCRAHAIKSAAATNSGKAIKIGTNMARTALATAIPSVINCFLLAIETV